MEHIMVLHSISAPYDNRKVLSDLSLDIPIRQVTAVTGSSECGKTTLLRRMDGLLAEEKGVSVSGRALLGRREIKSMQKDMLCHRVGLAFQTSTPFPFSIYKNMTYAPRYYDVRDKASLEVLVREKLRVVGLYGEVREDLGRNALKLSGGQQQGLYITRALMVDPEMLLLDGPCSVPDVKSSTIIEEILTELKEQYITIIVTHSITQTHRMSDYGTFLLGDRLAEWGEPDQLLGCPTQEETRAFLAGIHGQTGLDRNLWMDGFGPAGIWGQVIRDRRYRTGGTGGRQTVIVIEIPGRESLRISHVILDYNRTAAVDGILLKGVEEYIARFKELAHVYMLTIDTYGTVTRQCEPLGITIRTFPREGAIGCKEEIVKGLEGGMACLGGGSDDIQVFDAVQLSIVVLKRENMCATLSNRMSVVVHSIEDGLDLLLESDRLRATLRN